MNALSSKWVHALLSARIIDEFQAEAARQMCEAESIPIWQAVEKVSAVALESQLLTIAQALGTEAVDIKEDQLPKTLIEQIPPTEARSLRCLPVWETEEEIWVATADPFESGALSGLEYLTHRLTKPVVANPAEVVRLIAKLYPEDIELSGLNLTTEADEHTFAQSSESPVARVVDALLKQAIEERASDVHFEPFEDIFKIPFRVDGTLHKVKTISLNLASPIVSRLKVMADLNIAEKRKAQDGRIHFPMAGRVVDLRVSCLPTQYGESIVLRVLDQSAFKPDLNNLGLRPEDMQQLQSALEQPNGIILITGPTGSGKTTTLYSCLNVLNSAEVKILTAEDPVEYEVPGIVQIPIHDEIGLTFSASLRSFLRQDPDIIMIGEMRDLETAQIAIQSSLTGHLVLSTLHTNSAAASITRLIDMGVEPFLLSSTLSCILAQRLLRTCCPHCKQLYVPDAKQIHKIGLKPEDVSDQLFYHSAGCDRCSNMGYRGRKGIFELMTVSEPIRQLINNREPTLSIRQKAIELGMNTLRADGIRSLFKGEASIEEVLRYT
jgi:type IV pilus assembly protein PilB